MNLSLSPEFDARVCYLVVLICGLASAAIQVYGRFVDKNISGVWLVPNTWFMLLIYLAIPLALFWLMDRTGALNDTSLFAAVLIGLAYPKVLAGGVGGLKAPTGIAGILKPLQAIIDSIIKSVLKASARNDKRFEDTVVAEMRSSQKTYEELLQIATTGGADVAALNRELAALPASGVTDPALLMEKKCRIVYLYLASVPDFISILTRKPGLLHWWESPIYQSRVVVAAAVALFVVVVGSAAFALSSPRASIAWSVWRIAKVNSTEHDRFRSRERLRGFLLNSNTGPSTCSALSRAILAPALPVERVNSYVQILLQARDQSLHEGAVRNLLVDDLRVDSVDARSRIQQALVYLAGLRDPQFKEKEKELAAWNPSTGDSVTSLEDRIDKWRSYFSRP